MVTLHRRLCCHLGHLGVARLLMKLFFSRVKNDVLWPNSQACPQCNQNFEPYVSLIMPFAIGSHEGGSVLGRARVLHLYTDQLQRSDGIHTEAVLGMFL